MEEEGAVEGSDGEHRWIIDPLDGTSNFLHGIPHWAVSIGLERTKTENGKSEMIAGVVYDPIKGETFWAERGSGAFMNNRRLRVSGRRDLNTCLIGTGIPFTDRQKPHAKAYLAQMERLIDGNISIRRAGAASLDMVYVASGRLDAFWEYGIKPWDVAAGCAILKEAGGQYRDFTDSTLDSVYTGNILASNPQIVESLQKILIP